MKLIALLLLSLNAHADFIPVLGQSATATLNTENTLKSSSDIPSFGVTLEVLGVETEKKGTFETLEVEGLQKTATPGEPAIPQTGILLASPPGYRPVLTYEVSDEKTLPLVPAPAKRTLRCGARNEEPTPPKKSIYGSKALFPKEPATLTRVGNYLGIDIYRLNLNPIATEPLKKKSRVFGRIEAHVDFEETDSAKPVMLSPQQKEMLAAMVSNFAGLPLESPRGAASEEMIAIVADSLKSTLDPFVSWKEAKGIRVKVITYTEAGGSKEGVLDYLKKYYNQKAQKPSYLLMVGNKSTLPPFMESTSDGQAASDYRFSLLSGTDKIPDIFYGRFVADSANELTTQIQRAIEYEKNQEAGNWYSKATTIASDECNPSCDKESAAKVQTALKAGTYKQVDNFLQGENTATASNVLSSLSEGRTWLSYFGHGSGTSWGSVNGSFGNSTVDSVSNAKKLPIIIDVACLNASWVKLGTCFGKKWVTATSGGVPTGAVAFYGGSVSISWDPPAVMSVGIAKSHFEKKLPSLGATVMGGQLHLIEQLGSGESSMENLRWYNLFGDPSLTLRTDAPQDYQVSFILRGRETVGVETKNLDGSPVVGLTMGISHPQKGFIASTQTDSQGKAILDLPDSPPLEAGTLLTLSGYNRKTYQVTIR